MNNNWAYDDDLFGSSRLITAEHVRLLDAASAQNGVPTAWLMERAAHAVADAAQRLVRAGTRIAIVCGPGNNGGDGYVAARILAGRGFDVAISAPLGPPKAGSDAALAASGYGPASGDLSGLKGAELIVDALFGVGLSRVLTGAAAQAVEAMNGAGCPVLAVDLPSGIASDDGLVMGVAVKATWTVTFGARKPGHLLQPGRAHCGQVDVVDIGLNARLGDLPGPAIFANAPALWMATFPQPEADGHKYHRGHVLVLSGPLETSGAARLAARAAARLGAGLVTIAAPTGALAAHAAQVSAIMLRECEDAAELEKLLGDSRFNALVIGPGAGREPGAMRLIVECAARAKRALVLDADALTAFADHPHNLATLLQDVPTILTPHEGEFARLTASLPEIVGSRLQKARRAASFFNAVVVLKGSDTIIAAPDGRAAINETGSPYLATAGSGDVLAGAACGLLAQGMAPFEVACAAVWLHGKAGEIGGIGLVADDLPLLLRDAQRLVTA